LLKIGYSFQKPAQAKLKKNVYKIIGSQIHCGHIYLPGEDTEEPGLMVSRSSPGGDFAASS